MMPSADLAKACVVGAGAPKAPQQSSTLLVLLDPETWLNQGLQTQTCLKDVETVFFGDTSMYMLFYIDVNIAHM